MDKYYTLKEMMEYNLNDGEFFKITENGFKLSKGWDD